LHRRRSHRKPHRLRCACRTACGCSATPPSSLRPQESAFRGAIEIEIEVKRNARRRLNARFLQIDAVTGDRPAVVLGGDDFVGPRPETLPAPGRTAIRIEYRGEPSGRDTVGAFRHARGRRLVRSYAA
jgi:hypothetical protein